MQPRVQQTTAQRIAEPSFQVLNLVLAGIALFMALRNFRQNRGDTRGATRLAAFSFCCTILGWLWFTNHTPTPAEFTSFLWGISSALFYAALFWTLYMALEPHIRKRWPHSMVGWTRLLAGSVRDPLVGAHLLIGIAFGVAYTLLFWLGSFLQFAGTMWTVVLNSVVGVPQMLGVFVSTLVSSTAIALGAFFFFFILRALLRRQWLAAVVFTLVFTAVGAAGSPVVGDAGSPLIRGSVSAVQYGLATFILVRFGVLPMVVGVFVSSVLPSFPLTTDFSTWYAGSTIFVLAIVLGLTAFALHSAIGGRRVFKEGFLDGA
jgi:serine/threonine-protein kinase